MLVPTLLAIALLLFGSLQTLAQDGAQQFRFPRRDEILRYERIADLPETFLNTLKKADCHVSDAPLPITPVVAFRPAPMSDGYFTIARCDAIISYGVMFWQHDPHGEPQQVWFAAPNAASDAGFTVTRSPGILEWDSETKQLTAILTSDVCPRVVGRKTYRPGEDTEPFPSWVLTKIETRLEPDCRPINEWQTYWEATPWPELPKPTP